MKKIKDLLDRVMQAAMRAMCAQRLQVARMTGI